MSALATEPALREQRRPVLIPLYARTSMDRALQSRPTAGERTSESWLLALRSTGPERQAATADLHALLLRAARSMLLRRRAALSHLRGEPLRNRVDPEHYY